VGETYACIKEVVDGKDRRSTNWQEDQKEDVFLILGEVERKTSKSCQLGQ
jgi:hypothetical protein